MRRALNPSARPAPLGIPEVFLLRFTQVESTLFEQPVATEFRPRNPDDVDLGDRFRRRLHFETWGRPSAP